MIKNVQINGFRGIATGRINDFRKFNVFVGPNNSGKSAVLEALYLASAAHRPASLIVQYETGIVTHNVHLAKPDLSGRHPLALIMSRHNYVVQPSESGQWRQGVLQVQVQDQAAPLTTFELDVGAPGFKQGEEQCVKLFAIDSKQLAGDSDQKDVAARIILAEQLVGGKIDPASDQRIVFCWHPDLTYYGKGSASWIVEGPMPAAQHTLFCDSAAVQQQTSLEFYQRMLSIVPGWTQSLAEHFGAVFGLDPQSFTVQFVPVLGEEKRLQGWIAQKGRPALPIDAFGDGARAAFNLLVPLVALAARVTEDAPGLLLWEEPESFQNPATLSRLLAEMVSIVRNKPIQVFIATHSLEFVAYLTRTLQTNEVSAEDALLFRLDLRDGELKSSWFNKDNLVTWLESGLDPRVWKDFVPPLQFRLEEEQL